MRKEHVPGAEEVAEKVEDFTEGGFCYAFCGSKTLKDFANVVCRAFWRVVVLEQFLTAHKVRLFQHLLQPGVKSRREAASTLPKAGAKPAGRSD